MTEQREADGTAEQREADGTAEQRIVVGVDGSEPSKAALLWAIRQAAAFNSSIDAVISWHFPSGYGLADFVPEDMEFEQDAAQRLHDVIAEVAGPNTGVEIRTHVVHGPPTQVLLSAAKDAELLVVGSRGRGGFSGLLLGSVSTQCVHHASCPVVVVRE